MFGYRRKRAADCVRSRRQASLFPSTPTSSVFGCSTGIVTLRRIATTNRYKTRQTYAYCEATNPRACTAFLACFDDFLVRCHELLLRDLLFRVQTLRPLRRSKRVQ